MRSVKIDGVSIPIVGSGDTVLLGMNDLHEDIFPLFQSVVMMSVQGRIEIGTMSKLIYLLAKTADQRFSPDYKTFLLRTKHFGDFVKIENINAVVDEIDELMKTTPETEETSEKSSGSKKKE